MARMKLRSSAFAEERREYRLLYAISFPLFAATAALSRILPEHLRPMAIENGHFWTVLADARNAAHSVLPYAFMV
ncbi:hypothetical protein [Pararhizobium mangrovi]|uniref:Uncharacterized protein n=1 Tax=Pararhizobium mangrovi TaxID=2590452 RepID=A0A506U7Z3_9HYPH|nr:hypothetical protein [Pararhizobium mangrovi]TPW29598.1 hypothetical protein FJU11_07085 [Pararhizobium mangrovi]